MRTVPVVAVACSLFGGAWLELARSPSRSGAGAGIPHRAADNREQAGAVDCAKAAGLAHSSDYALPFLGNVALEAMDRVSVRPSGAPAALPGWRLELLSDRGRGGITVLEIAPKTCYVGDGVLADWPAADLEHAYIQLMPDPPPAEGDFNQAD